MRQYGIVVVGVFALLVSGCGDGGQTHIGHWTLDTERMEEEIMARAEAEGADGMAQFAISMISKMDFQMHIQAGGTFEGRAKMFGNVDHIMGRWEITPEGVVMTPETSNGEPCDTSKPTIVTVVDRNHMRAAGDGDFEMVFVRVDDD